MDNYIILHENKNHNIPIFIDSKIDEMGVMVDFDNNITEINNIYNFTYIINKNKDSNSAHSQFTTSLHSSE